MMCVKSKKSIQIAMIASCLAFTSCSNLWITPDAESSAPTVASNTSQTTTSGPYRKTTVGAVTGATVGAVAGLAIGATSGNAGEGFLLGSTVGAATGAGIGRALEGQEAMLREQEEVVRKQNAIIKQQGKELDELRNSVIDKQYPISSFNTSSLGADSYRQYDGNPKAQPYGGDDSGVVGRARLGSTQQKALGRERIALNEITLTPTVTRNNPPRATLNNTTAGGATTAGSRVTSGSSASSNTMQAAPKANMKEQSVLVTSSSTELEAPMPKIIGTDGSVRQPTVRQQAVAQSNELPMAKANTTVSTTTGTTTIGATTGMPAAATAPAMPSAAIASSPKPIAVGSATKKNSANAVKKRDLVVAKQTTTTSVPTKNTAAVQVKKETKTQVAKVEKPKAEATVAKPATTAKATSASDDGCVQAAEEAARGKKSTSDADTLFYYRRAIRLCPSEPSYYVEVGKVYVSIGRTEDAQHEFNKALELDPENEAAQNELSMIMLGAAY